MASAPLQWLKVSLLCLLAAACTQASSAADVAPATMERLRVQADRAAHYVSPDGHDGGPGSYTRPWRTIARGLAGIRPGQTLYIGEGTYRERITQVPIRPGRPDAPIRVLPVPGEEPVLQGLLWLNQPSYWTISGLNVTWDPDSDSEEHMIKLVGGAGWTFSDAEVYGARSFAAILVAGEPAAWQLLDNCVHDTIPSNDTNQDQLLYLNTGPGAGPGLVEGNLLFGAPNGAGIKLGGPSEDSGGGFNVTVRHNTIYDTAQNVMVTWRSSGNVLSRNIFGRVGENYGNIRGYRLTGTSNVVHDNVGFAAEQLVLNDEGYVGLADAGGNHFPIDPRFDGTNTCEEFRPTNPGVAGYGHRAAP